MQTNDYIYFVCGKSRNPNKAEVAHVRLGLNEPPEPVMCRFKSPGEVVQGLISKTAGIHNIISVKQGVNMDMNAKPSLNAVIITSISRVGKLETVIRLSALVSMKMFRLVSEGMFGTFHSEIVREVGCSWWIGRKTNINAKIRKRSTGESNLKVATPKYSIAPGVVLALSRERTRGVLQDRNRSLLLDPCPSTTTRLCS